jgi:hypothetical protein
MMNIYTHYKNVVSTFVDRISNMDEYLRRNHDLPSKSRLKKIQARWLGIIDTLRKLSATYDSLMENKSVLF